MKMGQSGLLNKAEKILVGINGNDGSWINSLSKKVEIIYQFDKPELEQSLTLSSIRFLASLETEANIFYVHTKGVTHKNSLAQTDWREYMEYFILTRWKECYLELDKSDVVGVDWHLGEGYMGATSKKCGNIPVTPHFSGNFWWATAEYLKTLPPLFPLINKYQCEFWVGMKNPKVSELWRSGTYLHRNPYPKLNYTGCKHVRYYQGANRIRD